MLYHQQLLQMATERAENELKHQYDKSKSLAEQLYQKTTE